jgi:hypothetical protein
MRSFRVGWLAIAVLVLLMSPAKAATSNPSEVDRRSETPIGDSVRRLGMPSRASTDATGSHGQSTDVVRPPTAAGNPWRKTGLILFGASWLLTGVSDLVVEPKDNYPAIWVPVVGPFLIWKDMHVYGYRDTRGLPCNPGTTGCQRVAVGEVTSALKAGLVISSVGQATGLIIALAAHGPKKPSASSTFIAVRPQIGGGYVSVTRTLSQHR